MPSQIDTGQLIGKISPLVERSSFQAVQIGKKRMEDLFGPSGPDYLPLVFGVDVAEKKEFPQFDRRELFHEIDKMACEQAWGALSLVRSESDAQPAIRPNTGTGTVASVFGLEQDILPDAMPWLQQRLTREQIKKFKLPDDIGPVGLMPYLAEVYAFYQKHLPQLPTFLADTQGPFDLAHLVYGDAIFYDIYDDPAFVHHLMELVTEAYIRSTEYMKKVSGESRIGAYHGAIFMPTGGVRVCEDTSTLLGPELIDEFVLPYTNRVLNHFGGGWVHYCGRNEHLMNVLLQQTPGCKYLNLGNQEKHDMVEVIRRTKGAGKVLIGSTNRPKGQPLEEHFRTALQALDGERRGLILMPDLTPEEQSQPRMVLDLGHRLQDEILK